MDTFPVTLLVRKTFQTHTHTHTEGGEGRRRGGREGGTICWLDLANAYGSVHHQLIQFTLRHYHAPSKLVNTVANLYTNLSATITTPTWTTVEIPLQVGVYQGDPLSTIIFNTVMCTLIEALHPYRDLGYTFSQSERLVHLLQYADDTCLIGSGPASCQELLQPVERWLQ